ncbi:MAG: hypothetical protein O3C63_07155 [Cyanobacteria bacterium]|nr:hypothetical protein [Cyanobacteriota bacterium]MDA1021185.1 hypothetical protein [Cyanobacteriota bacterium]
MAGEVTTEDDLNFDNTGRSKTDGGIQSTIQDIFTDPQKRIYAFIGIAVVLALFGFMIFGTKQGDENSGDLVPLVQEIDQPRAFEIVAKLKSVNIDAKVDQGERPGDYVVKVFEKAIESSYLVLARTNLLEDDDYGLFDQNDWAASDYDKRIKLGRAINGDLSRIISRMKDFKSATVRVNIPEQQLFAEMQSTATATVQLELMNEADELSKSQIKSIVNLLRGYVPDLQKDKISIVDTQGRNYSTFKEDDEANSDDFIDDIERTNKLIKARVTKYLDVVLGPKAYEVSISASISREKVEKQETIYKDGAVGARQTDSETLNAGSKDNVAGPGAANSKNYNSESVNETLLPSFEQKSTTYLPGRVTNVTVALAVDKSVPTMVSLEQLRESVAAIIGPEASVNDVKLTVVNLGASDDIEAIAPVKTGFVSNVTNFFHGGIWSSITKIFTIIAIVLGLLLVAIISLNFLSAAANKEYTNEMDPRLGNEFEEIINDEPGMDYGEAEALKQQEALLKEMMGDSFVQEKSAAKGEARSYSNDSPAIEQEQMQFDNLLNNFQSVANKKPEILARKIQTWLEEDVE